MQVKRSTGHIPRFFVADALTNDGQIQLIGERAHHLYNVLRASVGDAVVVFNGHGGEYPGEITRLGKSQVDVHLGNQRPGTPEPALKLVLAQGIARGDRMDQAIAKAVELGVHAVQPLRTERGKVRLQGERGDKKQQHWQRIATSAAQQCGRTVVPQVQPALDLGAFLQQPISGTGLVLAPDAEHTLGTCEPAAAATLLIGPESGFFAHEIEAARQSGYHAVRFGPRILRTETAGPACLAALQALWGDLA